MLGAPESSIWCEMFYKKQLFNMLGFCWFRCHFHVFFYCFEIHFDDFLCFGDRFEIWWFSMAFQGAPVLNNHGRVRVFWAAPGLHWSNQTVWSSSSTCKTQHRTCRNKGIRKNQDANCENTKYRIEEILRSLVIKCLLLYCQAISRLMEFKDRGLTCL